MSARAISLVLALIMAVSLFGVLVSDTAWRAQTLAAVTVASLAGLVVLAAVIP